MSGIVFRVKEWVGKKNRFLTSKYVIKTINGMFSMVR